MKETLSVYVLFSFCLSLLPGSYGQFLYPIDDNPPSDIQFQCFTCDGADCDQNRMIGTHQDDTCTGSRIACWTVRNQETEMYTRLCGQPDFIRQGVFCNRHMEGKEFCFGHDTDAGRVRLCAKCCLSDHCNSGTLQNAPDPSLQTCFACNGETQPVCNNELSVSLENNTYVEQCLLPDSDCWTERKSGGVYVRGCQLLTCANEGFNETCEESNGIERCSQCCVGKLCNRDANAAAVRLPQLHLLVLGFLGAIYQM